MRSFESILAVLMLVGFAKTCLADTPLPAPERHTVQSSDRSVTAVSDPKARTTTFRRTGTRKILWQLPSWERWLFVANDGKHAVVGYGGMNLIPQTYAENMVLFTFWCEGKKVRDVTLKAFVSGKSRPKKTVSHYHWGSIEMIDSDDKLVVRDANDKVFLYDIKTGLELK